MTFMVRQKGTESRVNTSPGIGNAPDGKESHVFKITITDKKGQTASAELRVTISK